MAPGTWNRNSRARRHRWKVPIAFAALAFFPLTMRSAQKPENRYFVNCTFGNDAELYKKPDSNSKVAALVGCGAPVKDLKDFSGWTKVRTLAGGSVRSGYIETSRLTGEPVGGLRAVAYRLVPDPATYHYEREGSSQTRCYGQGMQTFFDQFSSLNVTVNCQTVTTPAVSEDIDLGWFHVYTVVESRSHRYLLHCEAHWSGSNCNVIAIGIYPAWIDGGALWLLAQRGNGDIYIKYDILGTVPK
jgi:hypothetical protein